jgi:hypothetical protein
MVRRRRWEGIPGLLGIEMPWPVYPWIVVDVYRKSTGRAPAAM